MNHRCGAGDEPPAGIRGRLSDFWRLADTASSSWQHQLGPNDISHSSVPKEAKIPTNQPNL